MKISIGINYLLNVYHQFVTTFKFNPTSFIQKMLDFSNYLFKKQHSFKSDHKHPILNCMQSNETTNCLHDYSRMGFLDECVVQEQRQHPIGIVSNREVLVHNHETLTLPLTFKNYSTISLKEVYENLVKFNTSKLKTYQLFNKLYGSMSLSKLELYPLHHFKHVELLNNNDEDMCLQKHIVESQNLDGYFSSANEDINCPLSTISNYSNKTEIGLYCLDINEPYLSYTTKQPNYKVSFAFKCDTDMCNAETDYNNTTCISATTSNENPMINDNYVEQEQIVLDDCSEEMKTLISNFSLNLKSVTDRNPIELTIKHSLFSVSYENNPYFSVKDTPHIGYNSLMELEQDKELMVFPLCFYIKSVSSTQDNTNHKLFFLLEEQIDEDNDLSLDYVDNVHSGRIGLIYVSKSDIRKQYNVKRITQKIQDEVKLEAIRFVQLLNQ